MNEDDFVKHLVADTHRLNSMATTYVLDRLDKEGHIEFISVEVDANGWVLKTYRCHCYLEVANSIANINRTYTPGEQLAAYVSSKNGSAVIDISK